MDSGCLLVSIIYVEKIQKARNKINKTGRHTVVYSNGKYTDGRHTYDSWRFTNLVH